MKACVPVRIGKAACLAALVAVSLLTVVLRLRSDDRPPAREPARWGGDHVGRPLPEFTSGDQCLFCHRDIGPEWPENRHGRSVRIADPDFLAIQALLADDDLRDVAGEVEYVLGNNRRKRFLKSADAWGQLELLSVAWRPATEDQPGRLVDPGEPHWHTDTFADACAGCHATAMDADTRRFAAISLDCFVCHGEVPEDHTERPELARFSGTWERSARDEISVCGQCHLRGGRSRASGLPYANNFVPGDNLFLDFQVDLSDEGLAETGPLDRHIFENVRDVVVGRMEEVTCLTCHDVHGQSTRRHRRLRDSEICLNCHIADGPKRQLRSFEVHSTTCGY